MNKKKGSTLSQPLTTIALPFYTILIFSVSEIAFTVALLGGGK